MQEINEDNVYKVITKFNGTSFAELEREFGKGDYQMILSDDNIILWDGISSQLIKTLTSLINDKMIQMDPASILIYVVDGIALNYPLVKRPPKNGYKEIHWLPVVFNKYHGGN